MWTLGRTGFFGVGSSVVAKKQNDLAVVILVVISFVAIAILAFVQWVGPTRLAILAVVGLGFWWWYANRKAKAESEERQRFEVRDRKAHERERARRKAVASVRPQPRMFKTADEAEVIARDWTRYLGFYDAEVTPKGPDAGVDVASEAVVAQVKATAKPTGRPVIQQIYGAAVAEEKLALVYTLGGYTAEALSWADDNNVALFEFNHSGEVEAANGSGERLLRAADDRAISDQA